MDLTRKLMAVTFLASVALAAISAQAMAKPRKTQNITSAEPVASVNAEFSMQSPAVAPIIPMETPAVQSKSRRRGAAVAVTPTETAVSTSFASSDVVAEARRYLGGNPTGWSRQWCGAFLDLVLKRTGRKGGGNLASSYASYGTRVSGPQVGAIAVMPGHVGLVTGIDSAGNPIIISGNHNRRVEEVAMPRSRITAYVMP